MKNKWRKLVKKNLLCDEFCDFEIFNSYLINELNLSDTKFKIFQIDKKNKIDRNNIDIRICKHNIKICDVDFVFCSSCKRYIQNTEKFCSIVKNAPCKLCKYKNKIKKKFNLDYSDYLNMINKCNRSCEICLCKLKIGSSSRNACIDHCHNSNIVRGILCRNCNLGLGNFDDSIEFIEKSILFLKRGMSNIRYNKKKLKNINYDIDIICPISGESEDLIRYYDKDTKMIYGNINKYIAKSIGLFKDSVENLENAIKYLKKEKCPNDDYSME